MLDWNQPAIDFYRALGLEVRNEHRADGELVWAFLTTQADDPNAAGARLMLALADGRASAVIEGEPWEVAGVNSRAELAAVEQSWQQRRRAQAMEGGATLIAPETVWFAHDTQVGRDVLIEPNVVFGPGVRVADGAIIRAFSHIEGATVERDAEVGPYARLRPGAEIGEEPTDHPHLPYARRLSISRWERVRVAAPLL